jgi:hypothetical protein
MQRDGGGCEVMSAEQGRGIRFTHDVAQGVRIRLRDDAGAAMLDLVFQPPSA